MAASSNDLSYDLLPSSSLVQREDTFNLLLCNVVTLYYETNNEFVLVIEIYFSKANTLVLKQSLWMI